MQRLAIPLNRAAQSCLEVGCSAKPELGPRSSGLSIGFADVPHYGTRETDQSSDNL
jgi:hypothetical protein